MRPDFAARVTVAATVSPSEDPRKVLLAVRNVLGEAEFTVKEALGRITAESSAAGSLDRVHDQLRDRQVRGAARKRLLAGRSGNSATVLVNRQAATVGVVALCDHEAESPLGPIFLTIESEALDELIGWLTDYPAG